MDDCQRTQQNTLQEALGAYERSECARFHMPGHKGRGMAGFWRDSLVLWDVTELSGTDNLHAPQGAIDVAQRQMAKVYGAKASFFVVNGSTNAVQAMLLALEDRDKLLLSRDCHRSAISGAALRGIQTDYIAPRYDGETGLLGMVTPQDLDRKLKETGATAVLITSPNVYGCCADVEELANVAHRYGALFLVDGAHGAHYPFSPDLPADLGGKADLFALSQHKTMDALTQAASLHLGECRISEEKVRRALTMTETTSPSYLLMSSLDWSVFMAKRRDWTGQVSRGIELEKQVESIAGLKTLHGAIRPLGIFERDRTRLVIDVHDRGLSGYEAQALLEQAGIYIEMADSRRLVLITTPNDEPAWYERLLAALEALPGRPAPKHEKRTKQEDPFSRERAMGIREASFAESETIRLEKSEGRVAGEPIGVYPPGIAWIMPGERIEGRVIQRLLEEEQRGGALFGVRDGNVFAVRESKMIE